MRFIVLLIAALVVVGCGPEERKPIPVIAIDILDSPGEYQINGKRVYESELKSELQKIADENRRSITGNSRAFVRITSGPKAAFYRVSDVAGWCSAVGLDKVTFATRNDEAQPTPKSEP